MQVGRRADEAFDGALGAVGGSRPIWLILSAITSGAGSSQSSIANYSGIGNSTIGHHLDRLEQAGLIVRSIDPDNRRVRTSSLTVSGHQAFGLMREAALAFDTRLRQGMSDAQVHTLRRLLAQLGKAPPCVSELRDLVEN